MKKMKAPIAGLSRLGREGERQCVSACVRSGIEKGLRGGGGGAEEVKQTVSTSVKDSTHSRPDTGSTL